jgi:2-oxoglutarate ferredoxin oxidoreductase subunit alpha
VGTHADHPIIVLAASTVRDCFDLTVRAFNLSERFRNPVILLLDEVVAHMREKLSRRRKGRSPSWTGCGRRCPRMVRPL